MLKAPKIALLPRQGARGQDVRGQDVHRGSSGAGCGSRAPPPLPDSHPSCSCRTAPVSPSPAGRDMSLLPPASRWDASPRAGSPSARRDAPGAGSGHQPCLGMGLLQGLGTSRNLPGSAGTWCRGKGGSELTGTRRRAPARGAERLWGTGGARHRTEGTSAAAKRPLGQLWLTERWEESAGSTASPPAPGSAWPRAVFLPRRRPSLGRDGRRPWDTGLARRLLSAGGGSLAQRGPRSSPGKSQRGPWEGAAITSRQKEPGSGQETAPGAKRGGRTPSGAPCAGRLRSTPSALPAACRERWRRW